MGDAFEKMCDELSKLPAAARAAVASHVNVGHTTYEAELDQDGSAFLYALESKGILSRANLPVIVGILEDSEVGEDCPPLVTARELLEGTLLQPASFPSYIVVLYLHA